MRWVPGRQIGMGQGMAQIPSVVDGLLQGTPAGLAVGSPAWFGWLVDDAARSF